jgi:hypothetical protein
MYLENKEKKHNPEVDSMESVLVITNRLGPEEESMLSNTYKER